MALCCLFVLSCMNNDVRLLCKISKVVASEKCIQKKMQTFLYPDGL